MGRKQFNSGRCSPCLKQSEQFISGRQSGRHSPSHRGRKQFISDRQSGRCSPSPWGRKQFFPGNCSPSSWGRRQQYLPGYCSPSSWGRKQSLPGNCSPSSQGEGSSTSQVIAHLPTGEGSNSLLGTAHLPPREGSSSSQDTAQLPPEEAGSSPQASAHLPSEEGRGNPQAVFISKHTRSGRQGFRHSNRHRASRDNSTASQVDSANSQEGNPTPNTTNRLPQGSSNEEPNPKWVFNLSNKPLTPAQRSVLAKGPNFVVTPRQPRNLEYITAVEAACTKLSKQDAEELRADINRVLRSSHLPKPNLTKAQNLALRELKRDRDCIVLTADKWVAMVIMDRQDYISKANHLLNQNTYSSIAKDPTNSIKNKLINILKRVKNQTGLDSNTYKSMYPTGCVPPKFYGLPKIHKPDTPLRPINV